MSYFRIQWKNGAADHGQNSFCGALLLWYLPSQHPRFVGWKKVLDA